MEIGAVCLPLDPLIFSWSNKYNMNLYFNRNYKFLANAMYLDTPEDAVAKSDEQTRETSIETRSMRQWIRVDKIRYNCMDFRQPYGCSCQFLFCNPGIRSCGSCAVMKPDKWKNAVTGKDCICYQAYQNYFYPSYYKK